MTDLLVVTIVVLVPNDYTNRLCEHHGHWTQSTEVLTGLVVATAEVGDCASLLVDEDVCGSGVDHCGMCMCGGVSE